MQAGMVLASVEQRNLCTKKLSGMSSRGASTDICCNEISSCWLRVISNLNKTTERRQKVLKRLKVAESDSWGGGVHIFVPRRWTSTVYATKNRFLPLLEDTPIDKKLSVATEEQWTRSKVNQMIVEQVEQWLSDDTISYRRFDWEIDAMTLIKHFVLHRNAESEEKKYCISFESIWNTVLADQHERKNQGYISKIVKELMQADIIFKQMKGNKRERFYLGEDIMMKLAWDADEISSATNNASSSASASVPDRKRKSA